MLQQQQEPEAPKRCEKRSLDDLYRFHAHQQYTHRCFFTPPPLLLSPGIIIIQTPETPLGPTYLLNTIEHRFQLTKKMTETVLAKDSV